MVIMHQNNLEKTTFSKMYVRICPSFWYQMAIFGVLAHGLIQIHQLVCTHFTSSPPEINFIPENNNNNNNNKTCRPCAIALTRTKLRHIVNTYRDVLKDKCTFSVSSSCSFDTLITRSATLKMPCKFWNNQGDKIVSICLP